MLAGVGAGAVAIGATVAVERLGGRLGGLLGTLPTTIVPASVGLAAAAGSQADLLDAMAIVPVGMWVNVLFLGFWRVMPRHLPTQQPLQVRLAAMVVGSLAVWAVAAAVCVVGYDAARAAGVPALALGGLGLAAGIALGVWATWTPPPAPKGRRSVGWLALLSRGLLAALAIAASVGLASVAGPVVAGMTSVFPAIFLTSMVTLWWSQGEQVQGGAVGPMMLGASAVSAYALLAAHTLPALGTGLGACVAWVVAAAAVTLPAWAWLRLRPERESRG